MGSRSRDRQPLRVRQGSRHANVYNAAGDNLGAIHDVMIDKPSGKVAYAIMSFGGFLGMGNQISSPALVGPEIPKTPTWAAMLSISISVGWKAAPAYDVGDEPAWGDRAYESKIHDYYGVGPYWTL